MVVLNGCWALIAVFIPGNRLAVWAAAPVAWLGSVIAARIGAGRAPTAATFLANLSAPTLAVTLGLQAHLPSYPGSARDHLIIGASVTAVLLAKEGLSKIWPWDATEVASVDQLSDDEPGDPA